MRGSIFFYFVEVYTFVLIAYIRAFVALSHSPFNGELKCVWHFVVRSAHACALIFVVFVVVERFGIRSIKFNCAPNCGRTISRGDVWATYRIDEYIGEPSSSSHNLYNGLPAMKASLNLSLCPTLAAYNSHHIMQRGEFRALITLIK